MLVSGHKADVTDALSNFRLREKSGHPIRERFDCGGIRLKMPRRTCPLERSLTLGTIARRTRPGYSGGIGPPEILQLRLSEFVSSKMTSMFVNVRPGRRPKARGEVGDLSRAARSAERIIGDVQGKSQPEGATNPTSK